MVKLRFRRVGKKNRPYFRLCALDSRKPRDGAYLENLGFYDPYLDETKKFRLEPQQKERVEHWLKVGAQPSLAVRTFLRKADVQGLVKIRKPARKRPKAGSAVPSPAASTKKPKPPKKPKP